MHCGGITVMHGKKIAEYHLFGGRIAYYTFFDKCFYWHFVFAAKDIPQKYNIQTFIYLHKYYYFSHLFIFQCDFKYTICLSLSSLLFKITNEEEQVIKNNISEPQISTKTEVHE